MVSLIFPKQIDNTFRGLWFAIWLLVPIVLAKTAMGANSVFNTRFVATSADGIPLDSYNAGAADAVLALFALLGLCQLILALLGIVVLIRYRAMIPLMYLLLLIQQVGSRLVLLVNPIARLGGVQPIGAAINITILVMLIIGFVLSLQSRSAAQARTGATLG